MPVGLESRQNGLLEDVGLARAVKAATTRDVDDGTWSPIIAAEYLDCQSWSESPFQASCI